MADNTTELEVLNQIVDVLGGQSGQHKTVVPVLEDIRDLLGGGGGGGGSYNPSLSVGRADALTGADETAQWAQRESTGSGAATVRSVQGAAVAWNQMCLAMSDSAWVLITPQAVTKSVTDEVMTLTFNGANGQNAGVRNNKGPAIIDGHKYYLAYDARNNTTGVQTMVNINGSAAMAVFGTVESTSGREWKRISGIVTASAGNQYSYVCLYMNAVTSGSVEFRNVICTDLTVMFGSGNEPTTVAEFERMFPEPYYPYSAPTLKPVRIAGISSTDAQGGELDSVEWPAQTLRAAGSVADMLYSDHVDVKVGAVDLGTLNWELISGGMYFVVRNGLANAPAKQISTATIPNAECVRYSPAKWSELTSSSSGLDDVIGVIGAQLAVKDTSYTTVADLKASLAGVYLFYELGTPTTQPISPALPMTYRVEQGGTESIIVPTGEISAPPVLTVAEGESAADVVMDALACIAAPDGPVATANHAVGTYLTMQGKLYKVTSAIAVGESIVAGTNVTETTVMAELIARTA